MKAKLYKQTKDNVTWLSPIHYRHDELYADIIAKPFISLIEVGNHVFDHDEQNDLLYAKLPCQYTDKRYGGGGCTNRVHTASMSFDKMIQHIVKYVEPNFPGKTFIISSHHMYRGGEGIIQPAFLYKCAESDERKFNVDDPSFLQMTGFDELNEYITWFRSNGFNVKVVKNYYSPLTEPSVLCAWGHGFMFRIGAEKHCPYGEHLLYTRWFNKLSDMHKVARPNTVIELATTVSFIIKPQ